MIIRSCDGIFKSKIKYSPAQIIKLIWKKKRVDKDCCFLVKHQAIKQMISRITIKIVANKNKDANGEIKAYVALSKRTYGEIEVRTTDNQQYLPSPVSILVIVKKISNDKLNNKDKVV